jgi:hypothetical protein
MNRITMNRMNPAMAKRMAAPKNGGISTLLNLTAMALLPAKSTVSRNAIITDRVGALVFIS